MHAVTVALYVCPLRVRTGRLPSDKPRVLDGMSESVTNDRIVPVDQRREAAFTPNEPSLIALFGGLEDKAQSRPIPFVLDAVQAAPLALEAGVLCEAPTDAIHRLIGTSRQRLRHHRIEMLGDPATIGRLDKLMQGIFGEPMGMPQS